MDALYSVCVCMCVLLLLDSRPFCVCGLCLGVSVSHLVCFLEGVRSCFAADAEHKESLSGVWTIGQVWRYGGNRDLCMHTHTHIHFLSQGRECRGLPRARGTIVFPVNYDRLAGWKAGSQRGRDGKREGW